MKLITSNLSVNSDKKNFECGNSQLDNYIRTQAKQDVSRNLSACYVIENEKNILVGYFTVSASSINRDVFPDEMQKKLPPSYQELPTILLGRLALDKRFQGQKLGAYLLIEALKKCFEISESLGSLAVVVDPIDENAVQFYAKHDFILLPGTGKMFLIMKTIASLFK